MTHSGLTCRKIFDKDICKLFGSVAVFSDSLAARLESPDKDFLIVHEHSIELLNSFDGCFFGFEVDEAVTFRLAGKIYVHLKMEMLHDAKREARLSLFICEFA